MALAWASSYGAAPKERVRAVKDREGRERDEEDGEEEQADRWANVWESGFAWDGGVGPRDKAVRCVVAGLRTTRREKGRNNSI